MNTVTCMKFICFVLILKLNASQVLCSDEERIHLKESPDTANDINNVNGQSQYVAKSRSPRSSPAATYFRDWNRYLSPRSDGYNDVDEPKIDIGLLITVGGLGVAVLAVAFALNDLSNQIDDNKDTLSSIRTDTITLSNLFDDFSEEQAKVCELIDDVTTIDFKGKTAGDAMEDDNADFLNQVLSNSITCSDDLSLN